MHPNMIGLIRREGPTPAAQAHLASCDDCQHNLAHLLTAETERRTGHERRAGVSLPFAWSACSDIGKRRQQDDRWMVVARGGRLLAAVMDGVASGGHGGEAAQAVKEGLEQAAAEFLDATPSGVTWLVLRDGLDFAIRNLRGRLGATTATAILLDADARAGWVAHVGDSGLMRVGGGPAERLTEAHRQGRHILTSWLGEGGCEVPEVKKLPYPLPAEALVLASDGVLDSLTPSALAEMLDGPGVGSRGAWRLVDAALKRGMSTDNCTAVVVQVGALKR